MGMSQITHMVGMTQEHALSGAGHHCCCDKSFRVQRLSSLSFSSAGPADS